MYGRRGGWGRGGYGGYGRRGGWGRPMWGMGGGWGWGRGYGGWGWRPFGGWMRGPGCCGLYALMFSAFALVALVFTFSRILM